MTIGQLSGKKKRARVAVPKYERTIAPRERERERESEEEEKEERASS
jgi:hypothetical protein